MLMKPITVSGLQIRVAQRPFPADVHALQLKGGPDGLPQVVIVLDQQDLHRRASATESGTLTLRNDEAAGV